MIPSENKIGLIPRLWVQGTWGPQDWALFVTDQRTILILEKSSKAGLGGAFGAAGVLIASAASSKRSFDYSQLDAQTLATDPKNIVIPHNTLQAIRMNKKRIGPAYDLEIQYQTAEGKTKTLKGALLPPEIVVKQRKDLGEDKERIFLDYTRNAVSVLQNGLTPPRFQSIASIPPL